MSFNLNLELRGLCAIVPSDPLPDARGADGHSVQHLHVLVLDAREENGVTTCSHDPRLKLQLPGGDTQVVRLNGHCIQITGVPEEQQVLLHSGIWDVAQMKMITKQPPQVHPGFLHACPPLGMVASLRITAGEATGIDLAPQELSFQNDDVTPYKGCFARAVRMVLPIQDDECRIVLTRFNPRPEGRPQTITFHSDEGDINAVLTNLCEHDPILGVASSSIKEDSDFAAFYSLLPGYDGHPFIPLSTGGEPGEVQAGATRVGAGCIPAMF